MPPIARFAAAALALSLPLLAEAGGARLELPDFSRLASGAVERTDITLDGALLALARHFSAVGSGPEQDQTRRLLKGLERIEVHSYEFDHDDAYPLQALEQLRQQLQAPGWSRLVQTRRAEDRQAVDIFVATEGGRSRGLALIVTEPREFTVINLVGNLSLQELGELGGNFGIPAGLTDDLKSASD